MLSCLPRGLRPADPVFTPAAGPPRQVPGRPRASLLLWSALIALAFPLAGRADPDDTGLADLSLEELAMVEVTSVSKRPERVLDAAASIYVITHEDIRRSGYTTLPEVLRLAPNLQVAQVTAATYAITARGFNNSNNLSNKLLVLIDGRTVYSPIYSGVFWDQQDVLLEDVERIEVISGPGGTLWGANAVNGVINVITKSSRDTQGGYLSLGGGDAGMGGAVRYGAKLGETGAMRFYAKSTDLTNTELENGTPLADGWQLHQAGFRSDWGQPARNFTVQGDFYEGRGDDRAFGGPIKADGLNVLGRWNEQFDSGADLQVQAYFDRSRREDQAGFQGDTDTYDLEFQNGIPLGRHKVLWGGGYREAHDSIAPTLAPNVFSFVPQSRKLSWENVFVQDEFRLTDTLRVTLGMKFERNDYTGWENLPAARVAWNPTETQLVWGAASRAVRAPARLDKDFRWNLVGLLPAPYDNIPLIGGGPDFVSEVADVYELGYRAQPTTRLSYSVTAFYTEYDKLRSGQTPNLLALIPAYVQNMMYGTTYGVEAWGAWQATDWLRLSGGLLELRKDLRLDPASSDPEGPPSLGNDPEHQWNLRATFTPNPHHEFDVMLRSVDQLPDPVVPAYTAVDIRYGWRPVRAAELILAVQNLFDPGHPEFGPAGARAEFSRTFYAGVAWRL